MAASPMGTPVLIMYHRIVKMFLVFILLSIGLLLATIFEFRWMLTPNIFRNLGYRVLFYECVFNIGPVNALLPDRTRRPHQAIKWTSIDFSL